MLLRALLVALSATLYTVLFFRISHFFKKSHNIYYSQFRYKEASPRQITAYYRLILQKSGSLADGRVEVWLRPDIIKYVEIGGAIYYPW